MFLFFPILGCSILRCGCHGYEGSFKKKGDKTPEVLPFRCLLSSSCQKGTDDSYYRSTFLQLLLDDTQHFMRIRLIKKTTAYVYNKSVKHLHSKKEITSTPLKEHKESSNK